MAEEAFVAGEKIGSGKGQTRAVPWAAEMPQIFQ